MARPRPKNHRMITTRSDEKEKKRGHAPENGYALSCSCGWNGGNCRVFKDAEAVFARHVETVARYLCKSCETDISRASPICRKTRECLECRRARKKKETAKAAKEGGTVHRARKRDKFIRSKYGMGEVDLQLVLSFQNNECRICCDPIAPGTKSGLHIDHCHITGRLRGLLCSNCNMGLGNMKEDPAVLVRAVLYLFTEPTEGHQYSIPYHERLNGATSQNRKSAGTAETISLLRHAAERLTLDEKAKTNRNRETENESFRSAT